MRAINPERRAPASFNAKTYYTPGTATLTTIEGAVQTQSLNLSRQ